MQVRSIGFVVALLLCGLTLCAADLPLGHKDFPPTPQHPVGFRGDWTGCYPGATPPLTWSATNPVVWKAEVGAGDSPPIVVGDRLFIVTDGVALRCLRAADGKLLWFKEHHVSREIPAEAEMWRIEEHVRLLHRLNREKEKRGEVEREIKALGLVLDVVNQSGQRMRTVPAVFKEGPLRDGPISHAVATPCSDGKFVYAWLPTGVVVCYDMDGNRQWLRILGEKRVSGGWYGVCVAPSPALADGKLVIHYDQIYCLDAATGKTVWEVAEKRLCTPSPVMGQKNGTWYVAVSSIKILRLADGVCIYQEPDSYDGASPIFHDGMFCWVSHAMELPAKPDEKPTLLWQLDGETAGKLTHFNHVPGPEPGKEYRLRGLGPHNGCSPVCAGGLIYHSFENGLYSAVDARKGKWVFTQPAGLDRGPGMVVAGEYGFVTANGVIYVFRTGKGVDPSLLATNRVPATGGNAPVFSGSSLYLHASNELLCIGGK